MCRLEARVVSYEGVENINPYKERSRRIDHLGRLVLFLDNT